MGDFTKLAVWRKSHELTLAIYRATAAWPPQERFGLIDQARRAACSITANIAEGCGRNTDAELARFTRISMGSASELTYYMILARDLGYLARPESEDLEHQIGEVRRMLSALHRVSSLAARNTTTRR